MTRNLSLRHFRAFVAVANTASFTVAAQDLFLTQSALTATIQQFEETIGFKLFDRSTRRVAMTPEAERFKAQAEHILKQFDSSVVDLEALSQGRRGHVRIAAAASVTHYFLGKALGKLRRDYPDITVSLHDAASEQVERMVVHGEVDFAFASPHKQFDELVYTPLFEDRFGLVCSSDHRYARSRRSLRWPDLSASDYIGFTADTGIGAYLRQHANRPDLFTNSGNEVSNSSSLAAVLCNTGGYSVLPALAAARITGPDVVFRMLSTPTLARQVHLLTRKLRSLSPSSELLVGYLLRTLHETPVPDGVRVLAKG
ncbi:LysR family transcriptional regulator [Bordetella sp. BOR01]|uniref:LysR family transcriptional regulator n=1 Tax=Bordetella sp. BOR01 TaxID=2854779 RepID=UPI001C48D98D|nr:LysR family transcriptional regulator [Bordetella sp. BOR01]MBV7481530.1 LysR family transcriptional regulator [Bordetella sp. BOR01]